MRPSLTATRWPGSPGPASTSGETGRLTDCSPAARMVIVVTCLRARLIRVNAWQASPTQARRYWQGRT
jgi:hypothetical protein